MDPQEVDLGPDHGPIHLDLHCKLLQHEQIT